MFGVRGEGPVREELSKVDPGILWFVHHIVPYCLHETIHELQTRRSQHLDYFVPLVDVWTHICQGPTHIGMRSRQRHEEKYKGVLN